MTFHRTVRALGTLVCLACLVACGGESEPANPAPEVTTSAATRPPVERPNVPSAATSGMSSEAELRGAGELPSGFPKDFPSYPGATATQSMAVPGAPMLVTFTASNAKEEVYDFYRDRLAGQGWEIQEESKDSSHLAATKAGRRATLRLRSQGSKTMYGVTIE